MGRVGSCFDTAVAESWFATLKTEIGTTIWATREQHRGDVFALIQRYNRHQHSTPDYLTPRGSRTALPSRATARGMKTRCPSKRGNSSSCGSSLARSGRGPGDWQF